MFIENLGEFGGDINMNSISWCSKTEDFTWSHNLTYNGNNYIASWFNIISTISYQLEACSDSHNIIIMLL